MKISTIPELQSVAAWDRVMQFDQTLSPTADLTDDADEITNAISGEHSMGRLCGLDCNQNGSSTIIRRSLMDVDEQSARQEPRPPHYGGVAAV